MPFAFGYGSLLDAGSLGATIGRPPQLRAAELRGWRRRWSLSRDNLRSEKSFALADGSLPPVVLGLNIEPDPEATVNGALFELSEAELERLDLREMRYDRVEVGDSVEAEVEALGSILTYTAKPEHLAITAPPGAVILASYLAGVERALEALGSGQLERFRDSTGPPPVEVVEAVLVRDRIPPGNPRDW